METLSHTPGYKTHNTHTHTPHTQTWRCTGSVGAHSFDEGGCQLALLGPKLQCSPQVHSSPALSSEAMRARSCHTKTWGSQFDLQRKKASSYRIAGSFHQGKISPKKCSSAGKICQIYFRAWAPSSDFI